MNNLQFYLRLLAIALIATEIIAYRSENPCLDNKKFKIIGGNTAKPGQFPFIASLRNETNGLWGAASILNKNWLVTAAHCVDGYSTTNLSVVVGSNSITSGGAPYALSAIIQNPKYNPQTAENDLALLKVETEIEFDKLTQSIEISTSSDNESAIVLGWGLARWGYYPDELQFLPTRVVSDATCRNYWQDLVGSQICALIGEGAGTCCGDSGGPLIADGGLIGVVSYGRPCALGSPDIYTKLSAFQDWINEIID